MGGRRLDPTAEPLLWLGAVTALAEVLVAAGTARASRRRMLWAAGVPMLGALLGRRFVVPHYTAPDDVPQNAGSPPHYQPPPSWGTAL